MNLRSEAEILAAGAAAARGFPPLTEEEVRTIAVLLAPVIDDDRYWQRIDTNSRPPGRP